LRRFFLFAISISLIFALALGVNATPSSPKISYFATVTADSRCQVNMTVTLRLRQAAQDLTFPIPAEAGSVALNGSRVFPSGSGDKRHISLRRVLGKSTGDITFTVSYTLPDVVHTNDLGTLELQLPILSGLACPVEYFEFSVSMPTAVDTLPGFVSGYHQAGIEEYLTYRVDGNTITGTTVAALKDHETLSMKLSVTEDLFPQGLTDIRDWSAGVTAMVICGVLALVYWLLTLRFLPLRRVRSAELPDGYTAGDLGSILHLQGMDVTMTVLSWARLGYVLLEVDRTGRVRIHKRMHMGNERKESEQKLFRALFIRRSTVDTSGQHYAQLCLDAKKKPKGLGELVRRRSGNPLVFRVLASGIGLFGGVCIAINMGSGAVLQGLLILALGIGGAVSGYVIQSWGRCLSVHDPAQMILCLALSALWLLLGLASGVFGLGLGMVAGLLAAGWLLAWSGRRSEQGKLLVAQVNGLKQYLTTGNTDQFRLLTAQDPDYFFTLAPSAIALGKGTAFARRFGKQRMESCPYLIGGKPGICTAGDWMQLLQKCVRSMNRRAEHRPLETLIQFIQGLVQMILKR
jgi:hypothetical protein